MRAKGLEPPQAFAYQDANLSRFILRLGHSSIATTLDQYTHIASGMDREAAETVAEVFR